MAVIAPGDACRALLAAQRSCMLSSAESLRGRLQAPEVYGTVPVSQKQLLQQLEIHPHSYGFPADVFSYALVLLECATGQVAPKPSVLLDGRARDFHAVHPGSCRTHCLCCQLPL